MNKKQAILVIAHNNFWTLQQIIRALDSEYFDIYIHLDKKCNFSITELIKCANISKVIVYSEVDVRWADISQVDVEISLINKAISNGDYEYYHLISGVDFPIKSPSKIYNFFHINYPNEFVHFESDSLKSKKVEWVKYYWLFVRYYRTFKCLRLLDKISILFQKIIKINRIKNNEIYSGANWFSITDDFAKYVINKYSDIYKNLKYTRSSDEIFIQTLLYNSTFKNNIYNKKFDNDYSACMRLIDWNRGNPYVYRITDYDDIVNSNYMFVRKVDERIDKEIINKLYNFIRSNNE